MSIKETFEKKGTWELVYIVGFYVPILATISDVADNSVERMPLTIIGAILSTALGLGTYFLVKKKTHLIKIIVVLIGIMAISLISIPLQSYSKRLTFDTCDICGFVSVDKETHQCQVCASEQWDVKLMTGYTHKEQYVKEEQLFWYSTESSLEKVNFHLPEGERNDHKFAKDENWKPLVTENEVIEYSRKNNFHSTPDQ